MAMNEHLDATYEHLPPYIRKVAVRVATFTEFLGQILMHVKEWK